MHRKLPVRILIFWLSAVSFAGSCLPTYAQDRQLTEERLVDEIGSSGKSVIWNGVTPNGATGWVTLHSLVPSTVHDDVYMIVMNTKTLQSYGAFLTEMNDYAQMLCLPSGDYVIVTGGLVNQDSDDPDENLFFFEPEQIHVEAGVSSLYSVRLHDSENPTRRDYADLRQDATMRTLRGHFRKRKQRNSRRNFWKRKRKREAAMSGMSAKSTKSHRTMKQNLRQFLRLRKTENR